MTERQLPHSLEAEQSLLGAILVDCQTASSAFQLVTAEDFYSPRHARIFRALEEIYDRKNTVDEIILEEELVKRGEAEAVGGLEYLDELIDRLPSAAHAEHYARIIQSKSMLRSLANVCQQVTEDVYTSEASAQEQQDRAEQLIFEIGKRNAGRDFVPIHEVIDQHFERFDSDEGDARTVRTGFIDLDNMTTGLHPSELIIVAGRPSMGKTSFSMNLVTNAAEEGKVVAVFSLEVARDQLVQNLLCAFAQVDSHRLRKRASLSGEDWQLLVDGASRLRQSKIYIDDTAGLSPLTLKAKARRLNSRERLDLIVIDYLQLMECPGRETRQQEISSISRSLKALARELEVPVVTISQLSRGVESREDHRPRMSDLRESGAIEQDADLILLLYRDEYYHPEREESRGAAEVIVAKQRNGPTGKVGLVFRSDVMRFENKSIREEVF